MLPYIRAPIAHFDRRSIGQVQLSISFSTSFGSLIAAAFAFRATCSGLLAPAITDVIAGFDKAHASAICVGENPASAAIFFRRSTISKRAAFQWRCLALWPWRCA